MNFEGTKTGKEGDFTTEAQRHRERQEGKTGGQGRISNLEFQISKAERKEGLTGWGSQILALWFNLNTEVARGHLRKVLALILFLKAHRISFDTLRFSLKAQRSSLCASVPRSTSEFRFNFFELKNQTRAEW